MKKIRRIAWRVVKWSGIVLGAILLLALGAGLVIHEPLPERVEGPEAEAEAEALAARIEQSVDVEAWSRTRALRFTFMSRRYLWDRDRELVRLRDGARETLLDLHRVDGQVTEGGRALEDEARREALWRAYSAFLNDSFWLNPLAKLRDRGVVRSLARGEGGQPALLVHYTQGGITPGDHYLWYLGEDGRPTRWQMWVRILPIGGLSASWEGWERLSTGAWIATRHQGPLGTFELREVEGAASLEALLGEEEDPFGPLLALRPTPGG